jgi:hypothetical protein
MIEQVSEGHEPVAVAGVHGEVGGWAGTHPCDD